MDSSNKRTVIICVTAVICVGLIAGSIRSLGKSIESASARIGHEMSNASNNVANGLRSSKTSVSIPSTLRLNLDNIDNDILKVRLDK